jgi:hypothetical protein
MLLIIVLRVQWVRVERLEHDYYLHLIYCVKICLVGLLMWGFACLESLIFF